MQNFLQKYFIETIAILSIISIGAIMVYSAEVNRKNKITCEEMGGYYYTGYRSENLCIEKPIEINLKEK